MLLCIIVIAEFLKDTGRQFHKFMKSGRLPKVLKLAGCSK